MISTALLISAIVIFQLLITVFYYYIGWRKFWPLVMLLFPLGIAVFGIQMLYYERYFPNWQLPFKVKLLLKYSYILTCFQFISLYLLLFGI
ncbi:hypothetical protein B4W74_05810 [Staphylococcus intermedius]|uniref:Membrane spanning protein n=1 Tax=Staphylococcus intermedius NCTC 11048 TaxID=1141106 RepID=A0A380G8Q0_STAIN|nr:hypothetical protein B5C04_05460 [Staphylococcus intermedius]PNZ54170.1 hypothetical protein CD138_02590 [Staphylococcus intermedius NCTC 11048]PCF81178.1 hypothetical protein B4W74_05810 [Staphylococcus intermedius]PCF82460.1 hypothetical protein B4W70_05455 [Staphylococcus intermedius]PCF87160.1 hypothetical protein B4W75_08725 [Staphylococcus intermedius]